MNVIATPLSGVLIVEPKVLGDHRGFFLESYSAARYREAGIKVDFVQDNHSHSRRGVLRGLHYQLRRPQAKLVQVFRGEVFDIAVDIRRGSPSFGRWFGTVLSGENHRQLFIPANFAHGFCVLSESADYLYKCSDYYLPDDQCGIAWDDPDLAIAWGLAAPILSEKDRTYPPLRDTALNALPVYEPDR